MIKIITPETEVPVLSDWYGAGCTHTMGAYKTLIVKGACHSKHNTCTAQ